MRLGEVLHKWRLVTERGLRDVAKEMGTSAATLSRIERREQCDAQTLLKIIDWLGKEAARG